MTEGKDQFYFQGKFFDNQDDFWKYVKEWQTCDLDRISAERILDLLKRDIIMNIGLRELKITNSEFNDFVEKIFLFAMNQMDSITPPKSDACQ